MVDAAVSKTVARKGVTVRLCPSAPVDFISKFEDFLLLPISEQLKILP